jgi:23S rRNA (pseudouridine1915-N3)-methyltransferase
MHIHLIAVGTRMSSWISQGYEDYARRLPRECTLRLVEIPSGRRSRTQPAAQAVEMESRRMLAAIPEHSLVVALDLGGSAWDTPALAARMQECRRTGWTVR